MPVSPGYKAAVLDLLAGVPELRIRPMFGGAGVFCGDAMFGLIDDDELYLKTDAQTRDAFEAEGCAPWTYSRKAEATVDMGYLRAPEGMWDDPDEAQRWAALAVEAATRKRAKAPRKR